MQFFPTLDFASDKLYKFIKSGLDDYHAKRKLYRGINNKQMYLVYPHTYEKEFYTKIDFKPSKGS